ncbi:hybrid sensor histidine kinase/response regulator [Hydrogenophaga pseudoflava]|uniref:hybrid sensor histidine kinase/response regulator n=1 Tax=Hydrogenophaga pseudoflava TaxID=47421 RepID=UPI0027E49E80|nr:ATP-binding protein [Hydrogenophaga pseudoflava]MDQ7744412.1 ATP-binding protein [Hydrogenophaga pseudoflava]
MRPTSLREQLVRAAMQTTAVAMLLSAAALFFHELGSNRKAWVADLRTQAALLAEASVAALEFDDAKAAHANLALLKSQPRIEWAAMYDANGGLFATYGGPGAVVDVHRVAIHNELETTFRGSILELAYPIERDGEYLGTLHLSARHDIWTRMLVFAGILIALGSLSLAVAFYFFGSLQRRISAPLEKMTQVAQEVTSSHNWALRAPDTDYRDVALLVAAFNSLLSECQTRTSEIEKEVESRRRVEQELRKADHLKDVFLATLAHELRNPLAPMTSAVALLQMDKTPAETRAKAVVILDRQLKHMVRLINDLLDASRVATGKLSLDRQLVDMNDLVATAVEGVQSMAEKQDVGMNLHPADETPYVHGDAVRLTQVFSNLLNNACRYTPPGGQVDVTVKNDGASVLVTVQDTGIGVAPEMQTRIFDLFEQADKSLERGNVGLGVGLTLSRQIVELHEGLVTMTSDGPGKGSSFMVRLPRLQAQDTDHVGTDAADERPIRQLRILIADDNVDLAEGFAEILRARGHLVQVVHDGEAAIRCAVDTLPDIALLDIGMPKCDGYEVARRLRRSRTTEHIHLVAISGWGQASDKEAASLAGFDHHLVKPVQPRELERSLVESFEEFAASRPGELR